MPQFKRRAVASSFIFRFPGNDLSEKPQVALFRRSDKVRTYQNKYGLIAGSVEASDASPLATAWRELQEETTLTSKSLQLFRQGKPFTFSGRGDKEEEGGLGDDRIKLNWEHSGYKWFDLDEISGDESFEGVPRIMDSLRSVWFDIDLGSVAGKILSKGLTDLKEDRESGARQLASKALSIYANVITNIDASERNAWWKNARLAAWHIWKNGREIMGAPILNVLLSALQAIEKRLPPSGPPSASVVGDLCNAIKQVDQASEQSETETNEAFNSFLRHHFSASDAIKILTLSSSSTVTSCLAHALTSQDQQIPPLDIRILESRPLFEGVQTARRLASLTQAKEPKSNISIYTDASAAIASRDIDMVLIGADTIDRAGNVCNKTGSLPAILTAAHISPRAKTVVLSELDKMLPFDEPPAEEENDVQEMTQNWNAVSEPAESLSGIGIKNVGFEWVDTQLIDHIITERGNETLDGISQRAKEMSEKADCFFSDI
ncbi:hypothetical protein PT974_01834 [Cladobotryum mycophilum]|uniref:Nudix hydrolase domain-containing protein n=1 Tax=Cladobotryum mycophilum TaxID=491253 RepID=A0ABR0SWW1_9HYPO